MEILLGPLAGPEARRALSRGWVLIVRTLSAAPPGIVLLIVAWIWWFWAGVDPNFRPGPVLTGGLVFVEGLLVTAALVVSPALLAGSLAGEKAAGFLTLLLGSQVSAWEIIRGRLAGRLSIVGVCLLSAFPVVVLLGTLSGLPWQALLTLAGVPVAVALGGGGLALAASAVSRRGRDALLAVYLIDLAFLLAPMFGAGLLPAAVLDWVAPLSPYRGVVPLVEAKNFQPALATVVLWSGLAMLGSGFAAWRLRPAYLRDVDATPRGKKANRAARTSPMSDRPVLWKELHIEQRTSSNRFVRWLGLLLIVLLLGSAVFSVVVAVAPGWLSSNPSWSQLEVEVGPWIAGAAVPIGWLLQWSMGLRAAVTIASERERGTWESLLVTPLEGGEIVWAKIWGSLYALRWLLGAVVVSWTLCALAGAMDPWTYLYHVLTAAVVGPFMVAVGVWASLTSQTATRAMTITLLSWLGASFAIPICAGIAAVIASLIGFFVWLATTTAAEGMSNMSATVTAAPPFGTWFSVAYLAASSLFYLFAALMIAAYCRKQFDRLAGRVG